MLNVSDNDWLHSIKWRSFRISESAQENFIRRRNIARLSLTSDALKTYVGSVVSTPCVMGKMTEHERGLREKRRSDDSNKQRSKEGEEEIFSMMLSLASIAGFAMSAYALGETDVTVT